MSKPLSANDQSVKSLADDLWKEMLASSPIWGTFLGIEVNDGALDDNSEAARLRDRAMWERYSKAAAAIGDDGLELRRGWHRGCDQRPGGAAIFASSAGCGGFWSLGR